jgi:MoaA/NifB/PqqE/SkfB family radical SAM enzyme
MMLGYAARMMRETDMRLLWKFAWNCGFKGMRAVQRFEKRKARGEHFPAFLFISITNHCNLKCQGCWVTPTSPPCHMSLQELEEIIKVSKRNGTYFFGILGGEPLLHPDCLELFGRHPECYFQLFTNGYFLNGEVAEQLRQLGNVTPLISWEGGESVADVRRGGRDVYQNTLTAMEHCHDKHLIYGVATSICQSNFDEFVCDAHIERLIELGAHYVWYYIYRPVGPNPTPDLALNDEQITRLREFLVDARLRFPIMIVDAYWDAEGKALCPAAVGISHHVSPRGDIEPCPPMQFARENMRDSDDLESLVSDSKFLSDFREFASETTRGCVLLESPEKLLTFMREHDAKDSSGRGTAYAELESMGCLPGHHQPGCEIPEKHWAYRFGKRHWFFGFGAYG